MYVLAVDTSTSYVVAGLVDTDDTDAETGLPRTVAERVELLPRGHMEVLTPNIVACLHDAGIEFSELGAVVVGTGPGPFTGLRVGMATAAAFAEALDIPVHGVPSHVATACGFPGATREPILVVSDARRREWYWSLISVSATEEGPAVNAPVDIIAAHPRARVLASREIAPGVPTEWELVDADAHPTPAGLVAARLQRSTGLDQPAVPLTALYLRRPDAIEPARRKVSASLDFSGVDLDAAVGAPVVAELTIEDAEACARIEELVFDGDSPWSAQAFRAEIAASHTRYLGLYREGVLIGYAGVALAGPVADPEFEVHTIALSPQVHGRGWSRLLMDPLIELADRYHGPLYLEVRTDNAAAIGLYRSYGFDIVGTRRRYYQPSGADAYTMARPASKESPVLPQVLVGGDAQPRVILGVESSCDETGVGIVELAADGVVRQISNRVASSMEQHARFGGVVPEIASRAHLEAFVPTLRAARSDLSAATGRTRPDAVAATVGPGLAGALLVGAAAAKACAAAWGVPFYGVNHLGGHVAVGTLHTGEENDVPNDLSHAVALLVSGGHTQILEVHGVGHPMVELGSTLDDAAGEAYDKVARLLGLGYPGGPVIDRLAATGDPTAIAFPRGLSRSTDQRYDFSFSGLKTAVARFVEQADARGERIAVADLCASFQEAVVDVLTAKAVTACKDTGAEVLLLGGGVSANRRLRELAAQRCQAAGITLYVPPVALCTDNGVMIATLAAQLVATGTPASGLRARTDPSMDVAVPVLGVLG